MKHEKAPDADQVSPVSSPLTSSLFREEVLEAQRTPRLGTVLLEPKISHRGAAIGSAVAALSIILILCLGTFTRKESLKGWIVPASGILRVVPRQGGIVTELSVTEGQAIKRGDTLVRISTDLETNNFGGTAAAVLDQLKTQRTSIVAQHDASVSVLAKQRAEVRSRLQASESELDIIDAELALQDKRIEIAKGSLRRADVLAQRGVISKTSLGNVEADTLDQQSRFRALQRARLQLEREIVTLQTTFDGLPQQAALLASEATQRLSSTDQAIAEAESRREFILTAPQDGIVAAVQAELGGNVSAAKPVLNILPTDDVMQAQLFAPSRAIGFVKRGTPVLLRYQAFPYQNFGFYQGKVKDVSQTAISAADLPQNLVGLSDLYGANIPIYRIDVTLERQTVTAYGKQENLQAGMQLDADILIEKHRLIEWILYPLFARSGAWIQ